MSLFLDDDWAPRVSIAGSPLLAVPHTQVAREGGLLLLLSQEGVDEGGAGGRVGDGERYLLQSAHKGTRLLAESRDIPPPAGHHGAKLSEVLQRTGQADRSVDTGKVGSDNDSEENNLT